MTLRFGSALLALALVFVAGCSKPVPDGTAILGMWEVVKVEDGGKEVPGEKGATMEITADKMTFRKSGVATAQVSTYKLDDAAKHIDVTHEGQSQGNVGIYELKGDDLRLCVNDDESSKVRPTEFKSGKKLVLVTMRRVKK